MTSAKMPIDNNEQNTIPNAKSNRETRTIITTFHIADTVGDAPHEAPTHAYTSDMSTVA